MKKVTLFLIAGILFSLLSISCGGKKEENGGKKEVIAEKKEGIAGKWEIKKAEGTMAEMNVGTIYEFDGTNLLISKNGLTNKATFTLTGEDLTYSIGSIKMKAKVKIDGDNMIFKIDNSDQKFEMSRK
jgi:hypothetical protein